MPPVVIARGGLRVSNDTSALRCSNVDCSKSLISSLRSLPVRGIEPRRLDQSLAYFEHRHVLQRLLAKTMDQLVVEHLVADHGARDQLRLQLRIVEAMLGVESGQRRLSLYRRRFCRDAPRTEVVRKTGQEGFEIVAVVRFELPNHRSGDIRHAGVRVGVHGMATALPAAWV